MLETGSGYVAAQFTISPKPRVCDCQPEDRRTDCVLTSSFAPAAMALVADVMVSGGEVGVELSVQVFHPSKPVTTEGGDKLFAVDNRVPVLVLVHPFGMMGGCGQMLWGLAQQLAVKGYAVVTMDLRGALRGKGSYARLHGVLSKFRRCGSLNWQLHIVLRG